MDDDSSKQGTLPGADELLLNYEDAVLYGRDLRLVESSNGWLNDACIHYWLKRLEDRFSPKETFLLLDPAVVSFLVHQADEEDRREFRMEHKLGNDAAAQQQHSTHETILIPINDTMVDGPTDWWKRSGSHWTLLHWKKNTYPKSSSSIDAQQEQWLHYDSAAPSPQNQRAAQTVAQVLLPNDDTRPIVKEVDVPQQTNGYDCGVHVLATVEHILQQDRENTTCSCDVVDCAFLRRTMVSDILTQSALFRRDPKTMK